MNVLLHNKPRKAKIKTSKGKNFCKAHTDVNANADVDIYKWSRESTVNYLGTKLQARKIESKYYSSGP